MHEVMPKHVRRAHGRVRFARNCERTASRPNPSKGTILVVRVHEHVTRWTRDAEEQWARAAMHMLAWALRAEAT